MFLAFCYFSFLLTFSYVFFSLADFSIRSACFYFNKSFCSKCHQSDLVLRTRSIWAETTVCLIIGRLTEWLVVLVLSGGEWYSKLWPHWVHQAQSAHRGFSSVHILQRLTAERTCYSWDSGRSNKVLLMDTEGIRSSAGFSWTLYIDHKPTG